MDPAPLLAKARTLLTAYWQKTGDDAAPADLLARYGAQKATQVPVDRLPALIAELEGLTNG